MPKTGNPTRRRRIGEVAAATLSLSLVLAMVPGGIAWAAPEAPTPSPSESQNAPAQKTPAQKTPAKKAPQAALAAPPTLEMSVRVASDGTPDFDAASGPGNDTGAHNGIVRVNDTVTYEVEYAVPSGSAENLTWSITFPRGMEISGIPGYCLTPGSSLIPATAGNPALPISATSVNELKEQTLTCNLGEKEATSDKVNITATVLNYVHNDAQLPITAASITAKDFPAPVAADLTDTTVTASARLMWDISKNGYALTEDSGASRIGQSAPCPWDQNTVCFSSVYSLQMSSPAGGKGAMPAVGDVTFDEDVTAESFFPNLTPEQHARINADPAKYGVRLAYSQGGLDGPNNKITDANINAQNSARDSGTGSVAQSGPGQVAHVTISKADWSLRTFPKIAAGKAIPGNTAIAVSSAVIAYIPVATVRDFGTTTNGKTTLFTKNVLKNLKVNGFTKDDVQTSADQPGRQSTKYPDLHWNDYRTGNLSLEIGGGYGKAFVGVPGERNNLAPAYFGIQYEGPPGGARMGSGDIAVVDTQNVISALTVVGSNPVAPAKISSVVCDAWDNTKLHLRAAAIPGSTLTPYQRVPSGGKAVWISGYNNVPGASTKTLDASTLAETPPLTVQYAAKRAVSAADSACDDPQGPWFDDPALVPGNDPAQAEQGIYTAVGRIRAHLVMPEPNGTSFTNFNSTQAIISVSMRVADSTDPVGTIIPNWMGTKTVKDAELSLQELLASTASAWQRSNYVPGVARENAPTGNQGDRLILSKAQVRVTKNVRKGEEGKYSKTPPAATGNDVVQYQLEPTLTAGVPVTGILADVWVEDCLPDSQTYSRASLAPSLVTFGSTPADAHRAACGPDQTYIRWVLPAHEINTPIEPIILTVEVSPTAPDGASQNTVVASSPVDPSPEELRTDQAEITVANPRGVKLQKIALTPVVQANRAGQATTEPNRWLIRLTNTLQGSAGNITNPDIIDVLPVQDQAGTSFNGTQTFQRATLTAGDPTSTRILYTAAAGVELDPTHATNAAGGSTAWCDAPSQGTVVSGEGVCPTDAAQVTAIRVKKTGTYLSGDVIEAEVQTVGIGNRAGDVYVNRVMAAAEGLTYKVGPLARPETVISSSIGDTVWWDLNRNGVQDTFNSAAEPPVSGARVTLSGQDDLGNPVSATTTTGANGKYLFSGLRSAGPAGYTVTFAAPNGEPFTTKHAGTDPLLDSDADVTTGASDPIHLDRNSDDLSIDAGLLQNGGLIINKTLSGPGVAPFAGGTDLTFSVVCTLDGTEVYNDTVTIGVEAGATEVSSEAISPLPALASCVVTETGAGSADAAAAPVTVTVTHSATPVSAELTNYYSAATISVSKTVTGGETALAAVSGKTFEVAVTCQMTADDETPLLHQTVTLAGGDTVQLRTAGGQPVFVPLGATCFVEETDTGGATTVTSANDSFATGLKVTATTGATAGNLAFSVTNNFVVPTGSLVIHKMLEGTGVAPFAGGKELSFAVVCTFEGEEVYNDTVSLPIERGATSATSEAITGLPASSSCVVTETGTGGADSAATPTTVQIPWNASTWTSGEVTASLTNYYSAGTITVAKTLAGDPTAIAAVADRDFALLVTCAVAEGDTRAVLVSRTVALRGGETQRLTNAEGDPVSLPVGASCYLEETDNGGATSVSISHDTFERGIRVTAGNSKDLQSLTVSAVNTFELPQGTLQIRKLLEGAGVQPFAGGKTLSFAVVCTHNDAEVYNRTVNLNVTAGATDILSEEIGPFPASTECDITETGRGGADDAAAPVHVTIPWDPETWTSGPVVASLTNRYSAGTISVSKSLAGDERGIAAVKNRQFEIQVVCQVEESGERSTVLSETVKIRGGETVTLSDASGAARLLPLGAHCFGTETDAGGAKSKKVNHDSFENAAVVTRGSDDKPQALSITAVNTFAAPPVEPSKPPVEPSKPPVEPSKPPVEPSKPPVDPSNPPVDPTTPPAPPGKPDLPHTGTDATGWLAGGTALLLAGAFLLIRRRRNPHTER
ncbi:LPXTG cell wall anchor domain-containing protein [Mycetocola tolaasinivorans]|uniref:LPXTG cell wall anchor domain-containing protein n=1 Tax=Mycetocola tolaasinivorans TaxID=76635 RepID=A0A3L7A6K8_9MICO|nr:DUF5979 domain-containing protein [Mycetocola tolaasinivorans]RLP75201.1 LPXTG cell wall anchor domain-containing protein [Mycetocola tolaasinivorans]